MPPLPTTELWLEVIQSLALAGAVVLAGASFLALLCRGSPRLRLQIWEGSCTIIVLLVLFEAIGLPRFLSHELGSSAAEVSWTIDPAPGASADELENPPIDTTPEPWAQTTLELPGEVESSTTDEATARFGPSATPESAREPGSHDVIDAARALDEAGSMLVDSGDVSLEAKVELEALTTTTPESSASVATADVPGSEAATVGMGNSIERDVDVELDRELASIATADEKSIPSNPDTAIASSVDASHEGPSWWPGLLWSLGTALVIARLAFGRLLLLVWRRRFRAPDDAAISERVARLADVLGIRSAITLLETERIDAPLTFGTSRALLVIPAGFSTRFSPAQQDALIAHELGHIAGRHSARRRIADLATALLWWHPATWWLRARLLAECELAADEAAIVLDDGPAALAEGLVAVAASRRRARAPQSFLAASGPRFRSELGRRVLKLLRAKDGTLSRPASRPASVLVVGVGTTTIAAVAIASVLFVRPLFSAPPVTGDPSMRFFPSFWRESLLGTLVVLATGPLASQDSFRAAKPTATAPIDRPGEENPFRARLAPRATEAVPGVRAPSPGAKLTSPERGEPGGMPHLASPPTAVAGSAWGSRVRVDLSPAPENEPASIRVKRRARELIEERLAELIVQGIAEDSKEYRSLVRRLEELDRELETGADASSPGASGGRSRLGPTPTPARPLPSPDARPPRPGAPPPPRAGGFPHGEGGLTQDAPRETPPAATPGGDGGSYAAPPVARTRPTPGIPGIAPSVGQNPFAVGGATEPRDAFSSRTSLDLVRLAELFTDARLAEVRARHKLTRLRGLTERGAVPQGELEEASIDAAIAQQRLELYESMARTALRAGLTQLKYLSELRNTATQLHETGRGSLSDVRAIEIEIAAAKANVDILESILQSGATAVDPNETPSTAPSKEELPSAPGATNETPLPSTREAKPNDLDSSGGATSLYEDSSRDAFGDRSSDSDDDTPTETIDSLSNPFAPVDH